MFYFKWYHSSALPFVGELFLYSLRVCHFQSIRALKSRCSLLLTAWSLWRWLFLLYQVPFGQVCRHANICGRIDDGGRGDGFRVLQGWSPQPDICVHYQGDGGRKGDEKASSIPRLIILGQIAAVLAIRCACISWFDSMHLVIGAGIPLCVCQTCQPQETMIPFHSAYIFAKHSPLTPSDSLSKKRHTEITFQVLSALK